MVRHKTIKTKNRNKQLDKHNKHEKQGGRRQSEKSRSFINYAVKTKKFKNFMNLGYFRKSWLICKITKEKGVESWLISKITKELAK